VKKKYIKQNLLSSHNHGHPYDFLGHLLEQDARLLTSGLRNKPKQICLGPVVVVYCSYFTLSFHLGQLPQRKKIRRCLLKMARKWSIHSRKKRSRSNMCRCIKELLGSAFCQQKALSINIPGRPKILVMPILMCRWQPGFIESNVSTDIRLKSASKQYFSRRTRTLSPNIPQSMVRYVSQNITSHSTGHLILSFR